MRRFVNCAMTRTIGAIHFLNSLHSGIFLSPVEEEREREIQFDIEMCADAKINEFFKKERALYVKLYLHFIWTERKYTEDITVMY